MTPADVVATCGWAPERADEAAEALALRSGLVPRSAAGSVRAEVAGGASIDPGDAIEQAARGLGLEVEAVDTPHSEAAELVANCGPALLRVTAPDDGAAALLAVLGRSGSRVRVLAPDLRVRRLPRAAVVELLCHRLEEPVLPAVERLLERARVPARRAGRARTALVGERLRRARLTGCWLLRLPPGAGFLRQLRLAGLPGELAKFLVLYALSFSLMLLSWWTLGRGALQGLLAHDWLLAWALLLSSTVPPQVASGWAQAQLAVRGGSLLKRRLLQGALRLEPDEIRHQGAGQLLGQVIESGNLESHTLQGGFLTVIATIELALSAWVLSHGAAGPSHSLLLALWWLLALYLGWRYFRRRRHWTEGRLELTHDLVESLVGHRTRLVQEPRERWHDDEDRLLASYCDASRVMDKSRTLLLAVIPRGWVLVGIAVLLPAMVAGRASVATLALGVGGVLLSYRAFGKLAKGFSSLVAAWISWRQAAPIFHAAARSSEGPAQTLSIAAGRQESAGEPDGADEAAADGEVGASPADRQPALIEARELVYRYRDRARPVLHDLDFEIRAGDRLLLEGPSGGGKSTLAAILTRIRRPDSGLLLLGGLDRYTVDPAAWRRLVVSAPQFHENHVFTETFAFNLLLGRGWPPSREDMLEAEAVCRELGLGELLQRMPAGLLQLVGETGWQLSHGEKSRLYMARALLQGAELVILDESFAALDPENLHRCLMCALERAPTLLVIAHP